MSGTSLTVTDGSVTVLKVKEIDLTGATVVDGGGGVADVTITPTDISSKVTGPASNSADYLPQWDGVNSKTLKDGVAVPAGGLAGITALNLKAPIDSPVFTTKVTVPQAYISGAKVVASFTITNPTGAKYFKGFRMPANATITAVHLNCTGNVVVGQLWQFDANGLNGATVGVDITGVVDTDVANGAMAGAAITGGNYLGWHTTSVTGTPTYAYITFEGYYS